MAELEHKHPVEPVAQKHPQLPRFALWAAGLHLAHAVTVQVGAQRRRRRAVAAERMPVQVSSPMAAIAALTLAFTGTVTENRVPTRRIAAMTRHRRRRRLSG
jgi:hypothetical protein